MGGSLAGTAFPPPTNLDRLVARPFPVSTTLRSASPKRVAVRQLAIRLRDADDGSNPGFVATQRSSPVLRCVPLIGRGPTVLTGPSMSLIGWISGKAWSWRPHLASEQAA